MDVGGIVHPPIRRKHATCTYSVLPSGGLYGNQKQPLVNRDPYVMAYENPQNNWVLYIIPCRTWGVKNATYPIPPNLGGTRNRKGRPAAPLQVQLAGAQ